MKSTTTIWPGPTGASMIKLVASLMQGPDMKAGWWTPASVHVVSGSYEIPSVKITTHPPGKVLLGFWYRRQEWACATVYGGLREKISIYRLSVDGVLGGPRVCLKELRQPTCSAVAMYTFSLSVCTIPNLLSWCRCRVARVLSAYVHTMTTVNDVGLGWVRDQDHHPSSHATHNDDDYTTIILSHYASSSASDFILQSSLHRPPNLSRTQSPKPSRPRR